MPRLRGESYSQSCLASLGSAEKLSHLRVSKKADSGSASNLSVLPDKSFLTKKIPLKTSSFQIPRVSSASADAAPILPDRAPDAVVPGDDTPQKHTMYRAAETGKGELLPKATPIRSNRARTVSSSSIRSTWPLRRSSAPPEKQEEPKTQSLRSRRRSSVHLDEDCSGSLDKNHTIHSRHVNQAWSESDSFYKMDKPFHRNLNLSLNKGRLNDKLGQVLQALVVLAVTFLVLDSYYKALSTTEQLQQFKHEESMLMLHLHRVEQQSLHLHENLSRLNEQDTAESRQTTGDLSKSAKLDADLIWRQIQQLRQMEDELSHEVRTLQTNIQQTARNSIVRAFGEGPVQLILDVDMGEKDQSRGKKQISILLWYDTPHAAWALLEQVRSGAWDGAKFHLDKDRSINAAPLIPDPSKRLDFVESSQKNHEAWTVGLSEQDNTGIGMFINLQENSEFHKHDVCVGKVIDGFDVLQRLVELSRSQLGTDRFASIKKATGSHLTRAQTAGLAL